MDAFVAVDHLGDAQIGRKRAERIGLARAKSRQFPDQPDHVAQGMFDGIVEIFVKAHCDPYILPLGARALQAHVLSQDELERSGQSRFNRGEADLAIALQRVAVAG